MFHAGSGAPQDLEIASDPNTNVLSSRDLDFVGRGELVGSGVRVVSTADHRKNGKVYDDANH